MVKPATTWLRGLLRAGKTQQRTATKLAKVLFGPPSAKPVSKPRRKAVAKAAPAGPAPLAPPRVRKKAAPAPGKWLASHYAPLVERGQLPGRRLP